MFPGDEKLLFQPLQRQFLGKVRLNKQKHLVQHQVVAADRCGVELRMDAGTQRQHHKHLQNTVLEHRCTELGALLREHQQLPGKVFQQHIDLAVRAHSHLPEGHHVEAFFKVGICVRKLRQRLGGQLHPNKFQRAVSTCVFQSAALTGLEDDEILPLGKAFDGRKVFLMDDEGKEISTAEKNGEICVSGESLAEEYYHNPEETRKKFRWMETADGMVRYYCTGDLGYYSAAGELYFSGRKDFQIKHMGHRIELEEIEHALNQLDGVENSCCVMNTKKNRLVGFYFGTAESKEIKNGLKKKLPQYMIPHTIVRVAHMPLSKNGKIDRNYFGKRQEVVT